MAPGAKEISTLTIRPAGRADVPLVLTLIRELAEYERMVDEVVATEELVGAALFGERPVAEAAIAELDGEPVGFALFFHNFSTFLGKQGLYLEDLFVVPEWRGRGVGKQLLAHVASIAESRQCGRLEWTVLDWNESAIAFYRRMGAHVLDEWRICRLTGHELRAASTRA
jgi:GNAT superfamily N-acetyltransferase